MVHYQRDFQFQHLNRKGEDAAMIRRLINAGGSVTAASSTSTTHDGLLARAHGLCNSNSYKRARPKLLFLFLLSLLYFLFIWFSSSATFSPSFFLSYSFGSEMTAAPYHPPCSSFPNGTICCDRSSKRTDICFMKGDIRTHSSAKSIHLYNHNPKNKKTVVENIIPYTRKWETSVMSTVESLSLFQNPPTTSPQLHCDIHHTVPAVIFSTGGYTGNLYHEFNDGIIPLYITSNHFHGKVVFVIMEYHNWWYTKYGDVLSQLSDYPLIDFDSDKKTHCFPEMIVGLRIHDELTVDPKLMVDGTTTIKDFRQVLDRAYRPRIDSLFKDEARRIDELQRLTTLLSPSSSNISSSTSDLSLSLPSPSPTSNDGLSTSLFVRRIDDDHKTKPRLVILSRTGSRSITNEGALVNLATRIGFEVRVVRPVKTSELAKIYMALNESEVLIGVHGAAMTHLLFMRPRCVFIQIVPIGTDWAAENYYGEPAVKLGLKYVNYTILPKESSLYKRYGEDDPVIKDPDSIGVKGWEFTKKIYLDDQMIELDLRRFGKVLVDVRKYVVDNERRRRRREESEVEEDEEDEKNSSYRTE